MVIVEEVVHEQEWEVNGESLYCLLSFPVNLTLSLKKNTLLKHRNIISFDKDYSLVGVGSV